MDALGRITTLAYDAAGNQNLRVDGRGYATTYTLDGMRRMVGRLYPDASRNTFVYDEVSNRVRMEDTTGVTSSTFDPLDRRQSVVTPAGKAVTHAYDEVGLRASMMGPSGGVFTYSYTSANQLASLVGRIKGDGDQLATLCDLAADRESRLIQSPGRVPRKMIPVPFNSPTIYNTSSILCRFGGVLFGRPPVE
jgi:uncharacterized protein RhaS with RHS repeats